MHTAMLTLPDSAQLCGSWDLVLGLLIETEYGEKEGQGWEEREGRGGDRLRATYVTCVREIALDSVVGIQQNTVRPRVSSLGCKGS